MSINVDPPARDDRTLRERLGMPSLGPSGMPLPQRPLPLTTSLHGKALDAALAQDDAGLTAILDALMPADLHALAEAASRLRRGCEQAHNGGQGEPAHHGRRRWDFSA